MCFYQWVMKPVTLVVILEGDRLPSQFKVVLYDYLDLKSYTDTDHEVKWYLVMDLLAKAIIINF